MALHGLLTRGIASTLSDHPGELDRIARERKLPDGAGEHLAQALEALPGLLVALDRVVQAGDDARVQRMWSSLVSYLLLDEDLVPSRDGAPIEGLLDDAYLAHIAVDRMSKHVSDRSAIDLRSVAGGAQLLRSVLPPHVASALDRRVDAALEKAG